MWIAYKLKQWDEVNLKYHIEFLFYFDTYEEAVYYQNSHLDVNIIKLEKAKP